MGAPITILKILAIEPYRSIVNLLTKYKNGLELKYIQYAIFENPYLDEYTVHRIETDSQWDIKDLINSGKIKKYEAKKIKSRKKGKQQNNEGIRIRNNLNNMLKKMMTPPNNAIFRSNGRYMLSEKIMDTILTENDKKAIEKLSRIKIRHLDEGRINLYGFLTKELKYFIDDQNRRNTKINGEIKEKLDNAIIKIREGMDEIQKLVDYLRGWSISNDKSLKYINDKRYSILDRQLLIIFRACLFSFSEISYEKWDNWFSTNSEGDYVIHPDIELINIFKKHFYPLKEIEEIKLLLDNHIIDDDLSIKGFDKAWDFRTDGAFCFNMIAVVHSGTSITIDDNIKKKLIENLPLSSDEMKKIIDGFSGEFIESLRNYFESDIQKFQDLIAQSNIKEKIRKNHSLDIDDLINFHKTML